MPLIDFCDRIYRLKPTIGNGISTYITDCRKLDRYYREQWCLQHGLDPQPLLLGSLCLDLLLAAMQHDLATNSKGTANRLRRHVLAVWRYAARRSRAELRTNPAAVPILAPDEIEEFEEDKTEPQCWSMDELAAIIDSAAAAKGRVGDVSASVWHLSHFWFVYNTSARISAVMRTPIAHLDMHRGEVKIAAPHQKQKADQIFDLKPQTLEALERLRLDRHPPSAPIFCDWPYDPSPDDWRTLTKRYRGILERAGLTCGPKDLFHKLRRTAATFIARDHGILAAQQWLGHSHVSVTWRYIDKRYYHGPRLGNSLPDPKPHNTEVQLRLYRGDEAVG